MTPGEFFGEFFGVLIVLIPENQIKTPVSYKISKKNGQFKTNCRRVTFIVSNIKLDELLFLISLMNKSSILVNFIQERFEYGKSVGFGFSGSDCKFYIDNTLRYEEHTIESYEWNRDTPDNLVMRNYTRLIPLDVINYMPKSIRKFLFFGNTQHRVNGDQTYVKFLCNDQNELIQELTNECINSIVETIEMILGNIDEIKDDFIGWISKNQNLKAAWIQYSNDSFTLYLREK